MIKRVNFTGRKRIQRSRIDIEVFDGEPRTFRAAFDIERTLFNADDAVFLEAMCAGSTVVQRFPFGTVGELDASDLRSLDDIEGENVFFSLKIVDRSERFGRILGFAENIRPVRAGKQTATGRRGILPIERKDLGEELWQLEFREHDVYLLVNEKVPRLEERAGSDPLFFALVYPEVVRRILKAAFAEGSEGDEQEDRWPTMWLRFGKQLLPNNQPIPTSSDSEEERDDWIEEVVEAFCKSHNMKTRYASALENLNGGEE